MLSVDAERYAAATLFCQRCDMLREVTLILFFMITLLILLRHTLMPLYADAMPLHASYFACRRYYADVAAAAMLPAFIAITLRHTPCRYKMLIAAMLILMPFRFAAADALLMRCCRCYAAALRHAAVSRQRTLLRF